MDHAYTGTRSILGVPDLQMSSYSGHAAVYVNHGVIRIAV